MSGEDVGAHVGAQTAEQMIDGDERLVGALGAWKGGVLEEGTQQRAGHSLDRATLGSKSPGGRDSVPWGQRVTEEPGVVGVTLPLTDSSPSQRLCPQGPLSSPPPCPFSPSWGPTPASSGSAWLGRGDEAGPSRDCVSGILYGTMTMELGGRVTIECEKNNLQAELEFKLKVALAATPPATSGQGGALWRPGVSGADAHGRRELPLASLWHSQGQERGRASRRPHGGAGTGPDPFPSMGRTPWGHPRAEAEAWGERGRPPALGPILASHVPGAGGLHPHEEGASSSPGPRRGTRVQGRPPTPQQHCRGASPQPFFGGSTSINQISGKITSGEEVLAHLTGHWVRGWRRQAPGARAQPWGQHL